MGKLKSRLKKLGKFVKKNAGKALAVVGTVASFVPAIGQLVGPALIVAGKAADKALNVVKGVKNLVTKTGLGKKLAKVVSSKIVTKAKTIIGGLSPKQSQRETPSQSNAAYKLSAKQKPKIDEIKSIIKTYSPEENEAVTTSQTTRKRTFFDWFMGR